MAGERPLEVGTVVTYESFIPGEGEKDDEFEGRIGIVIDNADDSYTIHNNFGTEEISIDWVTSVLGMNKETLEIANKVLGKVDL